MCRFFGEGGREGASWLPAGGIRASQGLFLVIERILHITRKDKKKVHVYVFLSNGLL